MNEEFTQAEKDLIYALRNYRKSYPPSKQLRRFAKVLFDELASSRSDEEEAPE